MPRFLQFFFDNPILLFIAVAWLAGAIGNAIKGAKKQRARQQQAPKLPESPRFGAPPAASVRPAAVEAPRRQRTAEEVAAEMRRILGLEPEAKEESRRQPVSPAGTLTVPPPLPRRSVQRESFPSERPPVPVMPSTQDRHLEIHVDPHVGERIKHRQTVQSGRVGTHEPGSSFGTLGGRVHAGRTERLTVTRFPLTDLKRAFVVNEILQPPLALRDRLAGGPGG